MQQATLAIRQEAYGFRNPTTASSLEALAAIRADRSDTLSARELLEKAVAIRSRSGGAGHPRTADAIEQLADLEPAADVEAGAAARQLLPLLERGVAIRVATLGAAHPKTTRLKRRLGAACRAAGEAARADAIERELAPPAASDDQEPTDPPPPA